LRDEGLRYDPENARIAYGMALDLFRRKLHEGDLAVVTAASTETRH
jgi:hypothetical protein